jgi:drug/metabolite transporter (DMT)-like permease
MKNKELKASLLLLLAAAIWGFAFVAQRVGMRYVGAFTFNGVRFALGSISLIPLLIYFKKRTKAEIDPNDTDEGTNSNENKTGDLKLFDIIKSGALVGCVLFSAASLQQIGLAETTAGKAAFITGFYIVLVPFFGIFLKHSIHRSTWIAAGFALIGLYLLSVTKDFTISRGDLFELAGAFMWAIHILLIDKYSQKIDPIKLSFIQFATCSILSMTVAIGFESITLVGLSQALIPILYGGIASVGIAYTLQVVGQKNAKPSHAAIILSMESVFASIGGILMLGEIMGVKGYMGCALMLTGMLLSQLGSFKKSSV